VPRLTKAWEFALYDITGKEVFKNQSRGAFRSYNINHLAQGMYLWKLVYEDGKVENGKMVKQ
ncbi:MAG: T9SS type A sorting domain-containing protein, partial [Bacteroidetes bacterium]|nr:T9SS type A sorting domain-containing protein [Bacteroidota bacterium]